MGPRRRSRYLKTLGGEGLTTTIGWPQEVSAALGGQDLAAQPQARRAGGRPRRHRHQPQLPAPQVRRLLPDRHRGHQPRVRPAEYDARRRSTGTRASSATSASRRARPMPSGRTASSTSSPATTTPIATRSPASSIWSATSPRRKPREFEQRWTDTEIAALWQALAFRVEYRCFNCVATCPAEIDDAFHADTAGARAAISTRR